MKIFVIHMGKVLYHNAHAANSLKGTEMEISDSCIKVIHASLPTVMTKPCGVLYQKIHDKVK